WIDLEGIYSPLFNIPLNGEEVEFEFEVESSGALNLQVQLQFAYIAFVNGVQQTNRFYDVVTPTTTPVKSSKSGYDQGKLKTLLATLGSFDAATQSPDDLKKITGVGPVLQKKLNAMGLFTFQQISKMTNQEYDLFDEILGELPGRAKRDDWAGQASKLKNN
ncbi:MAG: hypothetical protein P8O02_04725, partial [Ulvibacter sp.]|nr:hypothetical protein [Ulvibacter sp.]